MHHYPPAADNGPWEVSRRNVRVEDFSLMDPAVQNDPRAFYALLDEHCPVYHMPETGMYVVSRYDDVRAAAAGRSAWAARGRLRAIGEKAAQGPLDVVL